MPATCSARTATPKCSRTATRNGASRLWERLRGMFAVAVWDARTRRLVLARDRFGIKPLYYRAAGGELAFASELDALPHGDVDLDALEAFLAFNCVPSPRSIFVDIRKLPPGHTLTWSDGGSRARAVRADRAAAGASRRGRGGARRGVPRAAARLGARAPRLRRARRRAALGRRRFRRSSPRSRREESHGAGAHVLDRIRRSIVRRARRRPRSRAALRHDPPRVDARARRGAAAAGARGRVRRAVCRLVGAADVPRLEARGRGREGRALRRRERRALRRLLHVRRRPARRAASAPPRRRRRPLADLLPSSTRKASFDYKAKRFTRAAGLPAARASSRLEGDLLRRRARGADRAGRARSIRWQSTERGSQRRRATSS